MGWNVLLNVGLVTGWVAEEGMAVEEAPARRLPLVAVLLASVGLSALPPAVALLILLGVIT